MSATVTMTTIATTDSTSQSKGKFRYVPEDARLETNPNLYHLPPIAAFNDVRMLPLIDIRPSLDTGDDSPYNLAYHGFTARHAPSKLHFHPYKYESWNEPELIKTIYTPEVEALVKKVTGCKTTLVESAIIRNNLYSEVDSLSKDKSGADFIDEDAGPCPRLIGFSDTGGVSPAPKVHLDFSPMGARTHIRQYHRDLALAAQEVIEAENALLRSGVAWDELKDHYCGVKENGIPRFAIYSIWRPLKTVRRDPLALACCATYPTSDYVPVDVVQPSGRLVPDHLSQIINPDPSNANSNVAIQKHAHLSGTYLSYGPRKEKPHEWHYISNQEPEDVWVIQLFDNKMEADKSLGSATVGSKSGYPVSGVMHSAFELDGQDYESEPRESIEVRVIAFW